MKAIIKKHTARRLLSLLLTASMLLSILVALPITVLAADYVTFGENSGAVYIDSSFNGKNVLIKNGVFSVTVSGAKNVNIIFDDVTMDRRYANDTNGTVNGLYYVSTEKLGWTCAQTCPLLITNNSEVTVAFRGTNNFYAGTNRCTVSSASYYTKNQGGGGFAGIQVDSGSQLTIAQSGGTINTHGAFYVEGDNSENSSYGYNAPTGATQNELAGGAGIGGGVTGSTTTSASSTYTAGTPGTIIINGGNINAYGGHEAAGIGGGLNGAATSSSIIINGGNITAYGGRWATGIGDGDSLQANWSSKYADKYSIIINGGTVFSVGGVNCPGIGATDEISTLTRKDTSGLEIKILGGTVTAKSGYPDGFNPGGTTEHKKDDAAAAIGAGNNTNMASNSISIASAASVIASGFGHYSITENGTKNEALPTVNIDSSGYMFLGRFPKLASSAQRTFELFEADRFDREIEGLTYQYIKYVTQPEDGSAAEIYYYCPEAPNKEWLRKAGSDGSLENSTLVELNSAEELDAKTEELALALWVGSDSIKIGEVTAPAFFRSIAITLPNPQDHGGIYALRIPTSSIYRYTGVLPTGLEHIIITIDAREQGVLSGELDYPVKFNIKFDSVSDTLTDLDIYRDGQHTDGSNGLIGDLFSENSFAYTVYIEHDDTKAYIFAKYTIPAKTSDKITLESVGDSLNLSITQVGGDMVVTGEVDMTGSTEKIIRLKKTDTVDNGALGSIVYKITIIKKANYILTLNPLGKVYDGAAVKPSISSFHSQGGDTITPDADELANATYTYTYYEINGTSSSTQLESAPKNAGTYKISAKINAKTFSAECETSFTISQRTLTVSRIENALAYVTSEEYNGWTAPHPIADPGKIYLTGVVGSDDVRASAASVSYNEISIGYKADKITLTGITLSGNDSGNYTTAENQTVFGQISYSLNKAIFRKKPGTGSWWDKFYPTDSEVPVNDDTADYHSPKNGDVFDAHSEYVYARTENKGDALSIYAVDIEFGAMYFTYSKSMWDPDSFEYVDLVGESKWSGFDGSNNQILIKNRSNSEVCYAVNSKIDFIHSSIGDSTAGIRADIYTENSSAGTAITGQTKTVGAATPGDDKGTGTEGIARCYIILSGVPQLAESDHFTVVGSLTVTISRSTG